jgi:hypothetical protein
MSQHSGPPTDKRFAASIYNYDENRLALILGNSGYYYYILAHTDEYTIHDYNNFLTNNDRYYINQNNVNPPFYILPGSEAAGDPTNGSFSEAISRFQTAVNQDGTYVIDLPGGGVDGEPETHITGHMPRNINQELLETNLDGSNFKFKHLINIVLNSPEVVSDYNNNRNKPTWIFWRAANGAADGGAPSFHVGTFAYIYISPNQQTIVMDGGYLSAPLYGVSTVIKGLLSNQATLSDGSNIFHVLLGHKGRYAATRAVEDRENALTYATLEESYSDTSQWTGSTGDSTGGSTGGTTGDASSPGDSTGGTTDGSTDTVVTATGAACSIVPKNFNLF